MLTPEQRSQRARIAALTRWSKEDPKATALRGQNGLRARFEREVAEQFPDISAAEQARRADAAYRAHFARLSFVSAKKRSAKAAQQDDGDGGGSVAA